MHLAWLAAHIGRTLLIILVLTACYVLYLIRHASRLAYGLAEIVIGLFAIFGAMGRAPKVVNDPMTGNLLLVQMAAGMYVVIRGFDNFAQSKPFAGGSTAFLALWDIAKATWVRIPAKDSRLDMASDLNPHNRAASLREALMRVWNHRPRLSPERSLALGTWALAAVGLWALRDNQTALERSQRAWIAPYAASHDGPIQAGKDFPIKVTYQNPGKEPAIDVSDNYD